MAVPGLWMMFAQVGSEILGSVMDGNSQAAGYSQQADAAKRNAAMADLQARQTYDAGLQNELGQRQANQRQQGGIRAAVGESGFDAASGTALAIQQQAAQDMEMNVLSARYGALLQGYDHEHQAIMDRYTEKVLRKSAKNTRKAGWINAATGVLKGVTGYYGSGGNRGAFSGGGAAAR